MILARSLKHLRIMLGLPQKAVAIDANLRRPLLSQIETGRVMPSPDEVRRIATAMNVSEAQVLETLTRQGSHLWQKAKP